MLNCFRDQYYDEKEEDDGDKDGDKNVCHFNTDWLVLCICKEVGLMVDKALKKWVIFTIALEDCGSTGNHFDTNLPVFIEGPRPEWDISSMIYSRDTPFWSGTLEMYLQGGRDKLIRHWKKLVLFIIVLVAVVAFIVLQYSYHSLFICFFLLFFFFFFFCVPSYISGVHQFGWDLCVCDCF